MFALQIVIAHFGDDAVVVTGWFLVLSLLGLLGGWGASK